PPHGPTTTRSWGARSPRTRGLWPALRASTSTRSPTAATSRPYNPTPETTRTRTLGDPVKRTPICGATITDPHPAGKNLELRCPFPEGHDGLHDVRAWAGYVVAFDDDSEIVHGPH